eukprot:gnl/TRDRNA2_/TRDRNA2_179629_c0_seq1.p1 gnl/TRDRNA2_/TRDRNA2_179629_c0~~gnl/TRDRNA2_/TRDRNA2_179629_c0_seq1.p1  ORF type:complete len:331 (+),score=33.58 gnl/TRDRNA2_/TRDRNA2_179629_c0_seq1:50-1042(+)
MPTRLRTPPRSQMYGAVGLRPLQLACLLALSFDTIAFSCHDRGSCSGEDSTSMLQKGKGELRQNSMERASTPRICIFQHPTLGHSATRERILASLATWVTLASNLSHVDMLYLAEHKHRHHLTSLVNESQMLDWNETDSMGSMTYNMLQVINGAIERRKCQWAVVPEDDAYVNVPRVAAKLLRMPAEKPLFMGSIWHEPSVGYFVHGGFYVMSAPVVPILLESATKCQLWSRQGHGDVELARCVHDLHGNLSTNPLPLNPEARLRASFGCAMYDNTGLHTVDEARKHGRPECLDYFHKVLPSNMTVLHQMLTRRVCDPSPLSRDQCHFIR